MLRTASLRIEKNLMGKYCQLEYASMKRTKISTESYSLLMPEELKAVELESRVICV